MTTTIFTTAAGKRINMGKVAMVRFLANGTDAVVYKRNGTSETLTGDATALHNLNINGTSNNLLDTWFNFNGTNGAGADSTYAQNRVNYDAVVDSVPTGATGVTAVIEGCADLYLDRNDAGLVPQLMGVCS